MNAYDTWKTSPYDDLNLNYDEESLDLKNAKEWAEEIAHHFYITENKDELEYALEELCAHLGVSLKVYLREKERKESLFEMGVRLSKEVAHA